MAHLLTEEQLAHFRRAFAFWDLGDGTIDARDLGRVMRCLGPAPHAGDIIRRVDRPRDDNAVSITFDKFLEHITGPGWHPCASYGDNLVLEAFAACDHHRCGYIPLLDLIRVLDEHLKETEYLVNDAQLVQLCNEALDASMFEDAGRNLAPEVLGVVVAEELNGFRQEQIRQNVAAAADRAAASAPSGTHDQNQMSGHEQFVMQEESWMHLTVVNSSGEELMLAALSSICTVQELQQHIEEETGGFPAQRQMLFLFLADHALSRKDATLLEAGLSNGASLMLILRGEFKVNYTEFAAKLLDVL